MHMNVGASMMTYGSGIPVGIDAQLPTRQINVFIERTYPRTTVCKTYISCTHSTHLR
jgi:hypothetical protein